MTYYIYTQAYDRYFRKSDYYKSKNIFQNIKAEVEKTVNDFIQLCIVINIE